MAGADVFIVTRLYSRDGQTAPHLLLNPQRGLDRVDGAALPVPAFPLRLAFPRLFLDPGSGKGGPGEQRKEPRHDQQNHEAAAGSPLSFPRSRHRAPPQPVANDPRDPRPMQGDMNQEHRHQEEAQPRVDGPPLVPRQSPEDVGLLASGGKGKAKEKTGRQHPQEQHRRRGIHREVQVNAFHGKIRSLKWH